MFGPYLGELSGYIMDHRNAGLLDSFTDTIGTSRVIFLRNHARFLLPNLVLRGSYDKINEVAQASDLSVQALVAENAPSIFSYLHLVPKMADCQQGLSNLLKIFGDVVSGPDAIFASCPANVLFDVVVALGSSKADERGRVSLCQR